MYLFRNRNIEIHWCLLNQFLLKQSSCPLLSVLYYYYIFLKVSERSRENLSFPLILNYNKYFLTDWKIFDLLKNLALFHQYWNFFFLQKSIIFFLYS